MELRNTYDENNNCIIFIDGEINTTNANQLWDYLEDIVEDEDNIILDFVNVPYISSAGFRVLLKVERLVRGNGDFVLRNVSDEVFETFKLVNYDKLVKIEGRTEGKVGASDESVQESDDRLILSFEQELVGDKLDMLPYHIRYVVKNAKATAFVVKNNDKNIGFAICTSQEDKVKIQYLFIEELYRNQGVEEEFLNWLVEKYSYMNCSELRINIEYVLGQEYLQKICIACGFEIRENATVVKYSMQELNKKDVEALLTKTKAFESNVKTVNEMSEILIASALEKSKISRDLVDPVFSRFYIKDDELLGLINGAEVAPGKLVMNKLISSGGNESKMAIIVLLLAFFNVAKVMLDEEGEVYFLCKNESQQKVFEGIFGSAEDITNRVICSKQL